MGRYPGHSDHLLNLERCAEVVLTTPAWQLHGIACAEGTASGNVRPRAATIAIEVRPTRVHLAPTAEGKTRETIDFEPVIQREG